MKFEAWKDLFCKVMGINEDDLERKDPDLNHDIRVLYDKAREND